MKYLTLIKKKSTKYPADHQKPWITFQLSPRANKSSNSDDSSDNTNITDELLRTVN